MHVNNGNGGLGMSSIIKLIEGEEGLYAATAQPSRSATAA